MSATSEHLERLLERLRLLDDSHPWPASSQIEPPLPPLKMPAADPLTRLPNRRAIIGLAERELRRQQTSLALILFDLDDFRAVNERYLLPGGDAVLKQLGERLASSMETQEFLGESLSRLEAARHDTPGQDRYWEEDYRHEFVGRFGGDRFLVVASNTTPKQAVALVERLDKAIREARFAYRDEVIRITASFGIAGAEPDKPCLQAEFVAVEEGGVPAELQPFIRLATDNMDQAKRQKRRINTEKA